MESGKILDHARELTHLLERLVSHHRALLDLLGEEYAHMASLDVKGLLESAQSKEVLVAEIWNHEQLRAKVAGRLAEEIAPARAAGAPAGADDEAITLSRIASALPDAEAARLRAVGEALRLLVAQARDANARNMAFAESSLTRIEEMKRNALGMSNNSRENYSNSGVRQPVTEQGGRLLVTEA